MSEDPTTIVRAFYAGLPQGRMDFEVIHPEITWARPPPSPGPSKDRPSKTESSNTGGLDELGEYLQALARAVDGMHAKADTFLADGDRVAVFGRECGTVRRTGTHFAAPFAHVLTVDGGRITRLHGYIDTALLARAFDVASASLRSKKHE